MKDILLVVIALLFPAGLFSQQNNQYTIKGEITGLKSEKVYLTYSSMGSEVKDSVLVNNGCFLFKGKVSYPIRCLISSNDRTLFIPFYLENSVITISGSIHSEIISGSKTEDEDRILKIMLKEFSSDKFFEMKSDRYKKKLAGDKMAVEKIDEEISAFQTKKIETILKFIKQYPDSYAAISPFVSAMSLEGLEYDKAFILYNSFDDSVRSSFIGKELLTELNKAIGRPAMNFTQPDVAGNLIKLSDYKGKYVLIDFWASWCGACRHENPNLLKAYNRFHEKGFEILSISLDSKKEAWLKAVHEDKLPWRQVCDLKGKQNEAALLYGIKSIPQSFLIDPNGKIVGKEFMGVALEEALEEIYK